MPSFAQGAPNNASSSSDIETEVEWELSDVMLFASLSCVSLMIVCVRLDAKPGEVNNVELEVVVAYTTLSVFNCIGLRQIDLRR